MIKDIEKSIQNIDVLASNLKSNKELLSYLASQNKELKKRLEEIRKNQPER